ncbi:MAG: hypothetical protein JWM98_952 [Thermoleophilia bacterium]|nr:hypothetical protein [Thermoleophilia bacterium]
MRSNRAFLLPALLIVLGVLCFVLQPVVFAEPDSVCAKPGQPTSGFQDDDKQDCAITQASYKQIADHDSQPKYLNIVGILLVLAGIVLAVVALVRRRRGPGATPGAP